MGRPFSHLKPDLIFGGDGSLQTKLLLLPDVCSGPDSWGRCLEYLQEAGLGFYLLNWPGRGPEGNCWLPWDLGRKDYQIWLDQALGQVEVKGIMGLGWGARLALEISVNRNWPVLAVNPWPRRLPWRDWLRAERSRLGWSFWLRQVKRAWRGQALEKAALAWLGGLSLERWGGWQAQGVSPRLVLEWLTGGFPIWPGGQQVPRLLLAGQDDLLAPAAKLKKLAQRLGADFQLLPGGHWGWRQEPAAWGKAVTGFWKTTFIIEK